MYNKSNKFPHETRLKLHLDDTQRYELKVYVLLYRCAPQQAKAVKLLHSFVGSRHVRESQQEYTVAALLSHSTSITASISLNVVAPFVRLSFGSERRENAVQTIGGR